MEFNFLDYFYTNRYDDKIIINNGDKSFSVKEIRTLVGNELHYINKLTSKDIFINTEDIFVFIILFLASIFSDKNIYISNNNDKTQKADMECLESLHSEVGENIEFGELDLGNIFVNFYTSGTTADAKIIKKSLKNVFNENEDLFAEFDGFRNDKLEFITSTPINHLFAITVFLFLGLNSKNIINTQRVDYPENLVVKNAVLITSPSFLSYIQKHKINLVETPKMIVTAGSHLPEATHEYFENKSQVINIFGCTETGVMGYKAKSSDKKFRKFRGIEFLSNNIVKSKYSTEQQDELSDIIEYFPPNSFEVFGRIDRIYKIQEKRISAEGLEKEILKNEYVKDTRIVDLGGKLGAFTVLSDSGIEYFIKNGNLSLIKAIKAEMLKVFDIVPQRWKFGDEIPLNCFGKIDTKKIKEIFEVNLSLPLVISKNVSGNDAEYKLYFYKNCDFFKGHFDGFPIVPGVIQLYYAAFFAKLAFGKDCHVGQIKRVKFSNIIHPDNVVTLKLSMQGKFINYEYLKNEDLSYSSGSLPLKNNLRRDNE